MKFPYFKNPLISIVIVNYKKPKLTLACLDSVILTVKVPYEVILVDNDSSLDDHFHDLKNIQLIRLDKNLHFIRSCNLASEKAKGKFLLFLNNDTVLKENAVNNAFKIAYNNKKIGILGAKLHYFEGDLQEIGCRLFSDALTLGVGDHQNPNLINYSYPREVDYTSGAFLFIRKKIFFQLNKFDESFSPAYYEDVDLCLKVKSLGLKVMVYPSVEVFHLKNGSYNHNDNLLLNEIVLSNRNKLINRYKSNLENQFNFDLNLKWDTASKPIDNKLFNCLLVFKNINYLSKLSSLGIKLKINILSKRKKILVVGMNNSKTLVIQKIYSLLSKTVPVWEFEDEEKLKNFIDSNSKFFEKIKYQNN